MTTPAEKTETPPTFEEGQEKGISQTAETSDSTDDSLTEVLNRLTAVYEEKLKK